MAPCCCTGNCAQEGATGPVANCSHAQWQPIGPWLPPAVPIAPQWARGATLGLMLFAHVLQNEVSIGKQVYPVGQPPGQKRFTQSINCTLQRAKRAIVFCTEQAQAWILIQWQYLSTHEKKYWPTFCNGWLTCLDAHLPSSHRQWKSMEWFSLTHWDYEPIIATSMSFYLSYLTLQKEHETICCEIKSTTSSIYFSYSHHACPKLARIVTQANSLWKVLKNHQMTTQLNLLYFSKVPHKIWWFSDELCFFYDFLNF